MSGIGAGWISKTGCWGQGGYQRLVVGGRGYQKI